MRRLLLALTLTLMTSPAWAAFEHNYIDQVDSPLADFLASILGYATIGVIIYSYIKHLWDAGGKPD